MVSVRKRGKVYEYRIEIASIDGTRKWLTKSGFKTKQEALHEGALAYNEYYYYGKKNKNRDMSFADYLDYWIDNYCNFNLKYATIVTYLNIIKVHLKPKLGMYKLSQIDSELIQNFINQLYVDNKFSKHYLHGILKTIKGALKYACYDVNFINHNPAEHVHIPRYEIVTGDPVHIYTQEEIERILDRFKDLPYIYYSFLTAYYTGLRVSEVYGLTWDNIDFENKTLTVDKNIIRKNKDGLPKRYNIAKGHSTETWFYGSCKNPQSRRTIAIGDTLIKALKEYKKLELEKKQNEVQQKQQEQSKQREEVKSQSNKENCKNQVNVKEPNNNSIGCIIGIIVLIVIGFLIFKGVSGIYNWFTAVTDSKGNILAMQYLDRDEIFVNSYVDTIYSIGKVKNCSNSKIVDNDGDKYIFKVTVYYNPKLNNGSTD